MVPVAEIETARAICSRNCETGGTKRKGVGGVGRGETKKKGMVKS